MKFTITDKKLDITEDVRKYAEKKIGKIERLFRRPEGSEAFVTFSRERGRYTAEVTVKNNGMFYRVTETTGDIFACVDSACASIERQIRKNKTRLEKKLKAGPIDWEAPAMAAPEDDEEESFEVVRTKRFSIKPMTVQEAILQMKLLDHEFYAFRNSEDEDAFSVVYCRKNGGYGLITDGEE